MGAVQEFVREHITNEVIAGYIGVVSIGAVFGARQVWKNFYKQDPVNKPRENEDTLQKE